MEEIAKRINGVGGNRAVVAGSTYGIAYFLYSHNKAEALDNSSIVATTTLLTDYIVSIIDMEDKPYVGALINGGMYTFVQNILGNKSYLFNFASVSTVDYFVELAHSEIKKYDTNK